MKKKFTNLRCKNCKFFDTKSEVLGLYGWEKQHKNKGYCGVGPSTTWPEIKHKNDLCDSFERA